jgi:putative proteasome-type protease
MTFCAGISVAEGVVTLADTQIVRGAHQSKKAKLSELVVGDRSVVVMTSGLRSVRDKTVLRLEDRLAEEAHRFSRMHELASAFGDQLRAVRDEDEASLAASGLAFNLNAILGGRLPGDRAAALFQVYPEGNWVETTADAPYVVIGRSYYGKPILDRLLTYETPLSQAAALAYLAFDATRASVTDVDFPIDVAVLPHDASAPQRVRLGASELTAAHDWWQAQLGTALAGLPMDWAAGVLGGAAGRAPRPHDLTSPHS